LSHTDLHQPGNFGVGDTGRAIAQNFDRNWASLRFDDRRFDRTGALDGRARAHESSESE
jgi:hypothetical protein